MHNYFILGEFKKKSIWQKYAYPSQNLNKGLLSIKWPIKTYLGRSTKIIRHQPCANIQQAWAFFMQLTENQKMKLIDAYKGKEGYEKISDPFQLTVSTVWNAIKLMRIVEVMESSKRQTELLNTYTYTWWQKRKANSMWH